ncbi:MAG TPA: ATP-binding protein [Bacteroidia bacterium]|nr:ATP-binding protein [Bacteroidia bacterium]
MENNSKKIRRVAILGAESTGKTTLARSLALRFRTQWVSEYAREYTALHDEPYSGGDIVRIAEHQLREEETLAQSADKFLFLDTEFIIAKIWSEDVFGFCPAWILDKLKTHRYDLYLLTANDLPWIPDPVRVNPQRRDYFFNLYKKELLENNFPFEIITGRYEARLLNAINVIRKRWGNLQ